MNNCIFLCNNCNNCGKQGHSLNQCKLPIISYGVIVFRKNKENLLEYLMIRRKDSYGYIEFIRGKYVLNNIYKIKNMIDEMSITEKNNLLDTSFDILWKQMWCDTYNSQYKHEEIVSNKKFELLKNGYSSDCTSKQIKLQDIITESKTTWSETEWEFPKGRKNHKERDLDCALREFEEETGISKHKINIVQNLLPFEEIFIGTNHKSYKHKYFLAVINEVYENDINLENYQISEVSKLEWKTLPQCLNSIRPYNLEKIKLISNINKILEEYSLY
jgi:8-oxo-dGTP pyrophosphatase MutT (NUDIX family)